MTGFDALITRDLLLPATSIRKSVDIGYTPPHLPIQERKLSHEEAGRAYLRVSTRGSQSRTSGETEAVAAHRGWDVLAAYQDAGISGAKGGDKRPGFDRLLKYATRRQFDLIGACSVDRLGRSLQDLVGSLGELHALGVDLYLHRQAVDTTTPAGAVPDDEGFIIDLDPSDSRIAIASPCSGRGQKNSQAGSGKFWPI